MELKITKKQANIKLLADLLSTGTPRWQNSEIRIFMIILSHFNHVDSTHGLMAIQQVKHNHTDANLAMVRQGEASYG